MTGPCFCFCASKLASANARIAKLEAELSVSRKVSRAFQRDNEKLIDERLELLHSVEFLSRKRRGLPPNDGPHIRGAAGSNPVRATIGRGRP